jgi:O-antigen/teichoic acid export membrane protein
MMGNAVTASLLPRLSYYYDSDRKSFYKLLDKAFQVMCVTLLPLCVGLFLVANHAVIFLYGAEFQPTALTIRLLCPLILIKGFGDLYCYQMAYASKNEKIIVPASATASAINVATNAVLIPSLMQNGAVIASVASELITNMVQFVYMKKKVKFKLNMKPLVQSIITVAAMAVCVWKVGTLNFSNTVLLALEVIVGSVVYVVLNILMKNQLMLEVINMTKQRIHNATKKRI